MTRMSPTGMNEREDGESEGRREETRGTCDREEGGEGGEERRMSAGEQ